MNYTAKQIAGLTNENIASQVEGDKIIATLVTIRDEVIKALRVYDVFKHQDTAFNDIVNAATQQLLDAFVTTFNFIRDCYEK